MSEYQPDWGEAPEGARFWARDANGLAVWWEEKPSDVGDGYSSKVGTWWVDTNACPNWRETLQERPVAPDRNDWSSAPSWAKARAWDSNGIEYWLDTDSGVLSPSGWFFELRFKRVSNYLWPVEGWKGSLLLRPTNNTTEIRKIREELAALTERLAKLEGGA
jgi:hypothetical protein